MSENRFSDVEGIEELVGQLVGAGSMMWANVDRAGIFLSTEAAKVMREGTERLSQILGEGSPALSSNKIVGGPGDGAIILREYILRITSHGVEVTSEDEDDFASDVEFAKAASMDMAVAVAVFLRGAGQPDLASEQLAFATRLKETLE